MSLTLYDPRGVEPTAYKEKFPELKEIAEYSDLSYFQLIFIWWYANPSCPLVERDVPMEQRVLVALDKSGLSKKLTAKELTRYRDLQFPDTITDAINRTYKLNVGLRVSTRAMFISIFENYEKIKDVANFTHDGVVDYAEYLKISTQAVNALPLLVKRIEEGMGVVDTDGIVGADADDADSLLATYQETKRS